MEKEMNTPIVITLEPWEYEWASHVGTRRYIENWGKSDAAYYDKSRMEDDRTAQVAACVAELSVAKYTNRYWSGHVWNAQEHGKYRGQPDVGTNIEVRRLRTRDTAAVRRKDLGKGLILFVAKPFMPELRICEIFGWIEYDKAWELGTPANYSPDDTRIISPEHLKL
jgi:hypothetical protein